MSPESVEQQRRLSLAHPAAATLLSELGRRIVFPRGIPFQAAQARGCRIDATLGQLTDAAGRPMPLPALSESVVGLDDREAFLYAPLDGPVSVRTAWLARQRRLAGSPDTPTSLPFVTHGLTHGLSLLADLFADADTDIVVPVPAWENYDLLFTMRSGARLIGYEPWRSGRFEVGALRDALASVRGKAVLILNFPSNPSGWWPDRAQAAELVRVVLEHPGPLVVATDDAYQGFVHEPGLQPRSLFWDLAAGADPARHLIVKCDAATKELVFFSSRVGFLTTSATGDAEAVLNDKLKAIVRGTVGSASGPALALVARALADPRTDAAFAEREAVLAARYRVLRRELEALDPARVRVWPFNSAFFVFLELAPELDAEAVRLRLLREFGTGTIAFPVQGALRLAYCGLEEDGLRELVRAVRAVTHA